MPLTAADPPAAPSLHTPIALLPEAEVARIKAGEVVERPGSAVKELVENALDAGATRIAVELEEGGKQLIRVIDNGSGIPAGEVPLALQRHATSKIRRLDDLFALHTLGFRGEGLAAIAAVSRLTLASRWVGEELGARVECQGGELGPSQALSMQPGTVVEVRDLFCTVPARLKFLRSSQAETSQVATLLSSYALAYPEVRFTLTSGGRLLLRSDGDGDGLSVLADLCGLPIGAVADRPSPPGQTASAPNANPFAAIAFDFPPMAVSGWISEPRHHRHNRSRQWYFVNRRPVSNKLLYRAVDDSLREFMSEGKHPQGAFFLDLPPEEIDVNVHPMKLEVSFAQPQAVYSLLTTAISRALGGAAARRQRQLSGGLAAVIQPLRRDKGSTAENAETAEKDGQEKIAFINGRWAAADTSAAQGQQPSAVQSLSNQSLSTDSDGSEEQVLGSSGAGILARHSLGIESQDAGTGARATGPPESIAPDHPLPSPEIVSSAPSASSAVNSSVPHDAPAVTAIQQIANSYLALLTPEAVYLVDQHAAHERILFESLYERLQADEDSPPPARQKLLFPLRLRLSVGEAELAEDCAEALGRLGFRCAWQAEARELHVSEAPLPLAGRVTGKLLHGALAELAETGDSALIAGLAKQLAASLACRAAVKAGDRLPDGEQRALVAQLLSRWSSLSCPHGRPTILRLGTSELEELFLR